MNVKTNNEKIGHWNSIRFSYDRQTTSSSGGITRYYALNTSDMKDSYNELYVCVMIQGYGYCQAKYFILGSNTSSYFGIVKDHNGYAWWGEASASRTEVAVHTSASSYQPSSYFLVPGQIWAR